MQNLKRNLTKLVVVVTSTVLIGCAPVTETKNGVYVTVSDPYYLWGDFENEDLNKPLKEYKGSDIFTRRTAEDIASNNEVLDE